MMDIIVMLLAGMARFTLGIVSTFRSGPQHVFNPIDVR